MEITSKKGMTLPLAPAAKPVPVCAFTPNSHIMQEREGCHVNPEWCRLAGQATQSMTVMPESLLIGHSLIGCWDGLSPILLQNTDNLGDDGLRITLEKIMAFTPTPAAVPPPIHPSPPARVVECTEVKDVLLTHTFAFLVAGPPIRGL